MISRNSISTAVAVVLLLLCSGGSAWTADEKAVSKEEIAASVNGRTITQEQLNVAYQRWEKNTKPMKQPIPEEQALAVKKQILEQLITKELLIAETERQKLSVPDKDVEAAIAKIKQRFPDEESFTKALDKSGLSFSELEKEIRDQEAVRQLIQYNVSNDFDPTDAQAEDFFNKNKQIFAKPKEVRASHILAKVSLKASPEDDKKAHDKIEAALKRVRAGEDFASVAREVSEDPSSSQGGDLGFFRKERMTREFSEAAFALQIGQISDVVKTRYGYHIIKVTDIQPEAVPAYEAVKDQVIRLLKRQDQREKTKEYIESLRKSADIQIKLK